MGSSIELPSQSQVGTTPASRPPTYTTMRIVGNAPAVANLEHDRRCDCRTAASARRPWRGLEGLPEASGRKLHVDAVLTRGFCTESLVHRSRSASRTLRSRDSPCCSEGN
jgi:hypothetical protein